MRRLLELFSTLSFLLLLHMAAVLEGRATSEKVQVLKSWGLTFANYGEGLLRRNSLDENGTIPAGSSWVPPPPQAMMNLTQQPTGHRYRRALSSAEMDLLLRLHNAKRRLEPSSDMEHMTWNNDLASMSADWAKNCVWEHGQIPRDNPPFPQIGQNLYATTGILDMDTAMRAWSDNEKIYYDYNTGACSKPPCGHYTQVVWATSRQVGCAHYFCPELQKAFSNGNYLVCNYGPAGNWQGQKPFRKGPVCTECKSGQFWCDDGLCRGDCSMPSANCQCAGQCRNGGCLTSDCKCNCQDGYTGPNCGEICQNKHANCGANPGWPPYWCNHEQNGAYVRERCPLMCGLCRANSGRTFDCPTVSVRPPTAGPTPAPGPTSTPPTSTPVPTTPTTTLPYCTEVQCANGGTALWEDAACVCYCPYEWTGTLCQESRQQARHGVVIVTSTMSRDWTSLSNSLMRLLQQLLTDYCNGNPTQCCTSQQVQSGDGTTFRISVFVGTSYPRVGRYSGEESTELLLYASSQTDNGLCQTDLPQDVLMNTLQPLTARLNAEVQSCCDSILFTVRRAQELPHRPLPGGTTPMAPDEQGGGFPIWVAVFLAVLLVSAVNVAVFIFIWRRKQRGDKTAAPTTRRTPPPRPVSPPMAVQGGPKTVNFLPKSPKSILKSNKGGRREPPVAEETTPSTHINGFGTNTGMVREMAHNYDNLAYNYN